MSVTLGIVGLIGDPWHAQSVRHLAVAGFMFSHLCLALVKDVLCNHSALGNDIVAHLNLVFVLVPCPSLGCLSFLVLFWTCLVQLLQLIRQKVKK